MKKKSLALVLALFWLMLLCACAAPAPDAPETAAPASTPQPAETPTPEPVEEAQPPEAPAFSLSVFHHDNSAAHAQQVRYGSHEQLRELYELAAEIGNRYGIRIRIADLVPEVIMVDGNDQMLDPALIRHALETVDRVLSIYPEGFFDQLVYGDYDALELYIVGFSPIGTGYAGQIGVEGESVNYICLDAETRELIDAFCYVLPHELTHVMDFRFTTLAERDPNCLFSEETWAALNPPGFAYAYEDNEMENEMYDRFPEYFSYSYGAHDPLEDRATLFGDLVSCYLLDNYAIGLGEGALDKLEYYLACVRGGFDTSLWPEQTPWEVAFARLSGIEAAA